MNEVPIWLTESDVVSLLDMGEAIAALEKGLSLEAAGTAQNLVKTHALWNGGSTLHAIGGVFENEGFACTKTWVNTRLGSSSMLLLFDSRDGTLKAMIEATALGQLRTGGITGVATKRLARSNAAELGLIGTGKQAMPQLAAIAAVRRLDCVRVFGRDTAKRDALLGKIRDTLGLTAIAADSVAGACDGADIVTVVTRATKPVIESGMLARGSHFNAVGAITPERMEFEPALLGRADAIVVDSVEQVRALSREFMDFFKEDETGWAHVQPLSSLLGARKSRAADADLTVFKSMGMGISDLSLAVEIYRAATARGIGQKLPKRMKAEPRFTAALPQGA